MITGNLIRAIAGKSNIVVATRFGSIAVPTGRITKKEKLKKTKKIVLDMIPKSEYIGSVERSGTLDPVLFFSAPKGWKGGVNA